MATVSDLSNSKYLSKGDVAKPVVVTVTGLQQENVARQNEKPKMKYIMYFKELDKGLVMNPTNGNAMLAITGSEQLEAWTGAKIVLFNDPTVSFGQKQVGGIRIRAPKNQPSQMKPRPQVAEMREKMQQAHPANKPEPEPDNDLPEDIENPPEDINEDDIPF